MHHQKKNEEYPCKTNHEFFALKTFTEAFYMQTALIGAVNNYYQVALIVT